MNNRFSLFSKPLTTGLIILLLLLKVNVSAQQSKSAQVLDWSEIESAVKTGKLLRESLNKIQIRKQTAQQNGDEINLGRSYYYTMLIKDQLKEDSLYFKNSSFIDSLLTNANTKPVLKSIMHLMQARRITNFNLKYLKFQRSNYQTRNLKYNYAILSKQQLDSVALYHWNKAASVAFGQSIRSYDLLWLSSVPAIFLFEPDQSDVAITEKICNAIFKIGYINKLKAADPKVISYSSAKFMLITDSLSKSNDADANVFRYYREWSNKYKQDAEKQAYIETCIRKYYYSRNREDSTATKNYQHYLLQQTNSSYNMVSAAAAFQLFNLYLEEGQKYEGGFKTIYSSYYKKALQVYEENKTSLNIYDKLKRRTLTLLQIIKRQQLEVSLNQVNIPGAPLLLQAKYQNIPRINYRIVKVGSAEHLPLLKNELYQFLYKKTPVIADVISLPDPADYNVHGAYLKLQPLPAGIYYLLFSGKELNKDDGTSAVPFVVSNMAAVNTNGQLFVLNRKSGLPLKDVKVTVNYPAHKDGKKLIPALKKQYTSDQQGVINPDKRETDKFLLIQGTDTLTHTFQTSIQRPSKAVFNKENYDDLEGFYDEQTKIMVYTDRGIYRPGQTVYFKAVLLSRNPKTGEQIIFNKAAGKAFKTWLKENNPKLNLTDANNRKLDSITMVTDDFGSFSGSFVLPETAITGQWSIESKTVDNFYNSGEFSVEEYKRPTFEMVLKKPAQQPAPGESFELKLKVNSLSGADLNQVQIKYSVERNSEDPETTPINSWQRYNYVTSKLLDTTSFTNDKGELIIKITDSLLHLQNFTQNREWRFNYKLKAIAIEGSGEQVELTEDYSISSWPFIISANMKPFYEKGNPPVISPIVMSDDKKIDAGPLAISIYKITYIDDPGASRIVDQWMYSPDEFNKWFPDQNFKLTTSEITEKKLVFSDVLQTANEKFALSRANLTAGQYDLVITAKKQDQIAGRSNNSFRVFDNQKPHPEVTKFSYLPSNSFKAGDSVTHYLNLPDSTYLISGLTYYASNASGISIKDTCNTTFEKGGLLKYQFKIPADAVQKLTLNYAYVRNNQIYNQREEIYLYKPLQSEPEIIVEKYRKVMAPGAKETFTVAIKTADKSVAAQLMTTIYDAALDKLKNHTWHKPENNNNFGYLNTNWSSSIGFFKREVANYKTVSPTAENELDQEQISSYNNPGYLGLAGMVSGLEISYSRKQMTGTSVITIRGNTSVMDYTQPLIIVDGMIYNGQLKDFNASSITQAIVLKGADAAAIYGARAAHGVLVLSTKGKIILPGSEENPLVKVRKNFNETAVFIPKIYADKNGMYTFSFTMPESTTEWNWKMLAHTKDGVFTYAERKLNTRLNLMVQPHMPRLLYQGDELNLQSRMTNIDTLSLTGKATCKIEDAVTGEDLTRIIVPEAVNNFSLAGKSNSYTAFKLKVPPTQVNPLKVVVTVTTANAADAEEHIIPVMSRQIFVKQNIPLSFSAKDTVVQAIKLPDDSRLYGIGLSVNPKPRAALINALPWLANYSYDCAEQTFNKMLAHLTALNIMQQDKNAQALFTAAKQAQAAKTNHPKKNNELAEDITKVVTPWLKLDAQQTSQQAQLLTLLDTVKTKEKINKHLQKLYELQNPDGGMPWFTGGKSNTYISSYLLAGFGKLHAGLWKADDLNHQKFIKKLLDYCVANNQQNIDFYSDYARSFWQQTFPTTSLSDLKTKLNTAYKTGYPQSLRSRLLAILAATRLFTPADPLYRKAKTDLESIRQLAINDPVNGIRWKEIADQDNLDTNTEEMTELLSEAFSADKAIVKGMLQWLMTTRQDQHWATTTGTAAAINLLMKENGSALAEPKTLSALAGNTKLTVSDNLLDGNLTDFSKQAKTVSAVSVNKTNADRANGSLTWYYFTGAQNLKRLNTAVKLEKTLQVFSDKQNKWVAVNQEFVFKIGMQVKVNLSIETPKALTFVQLDDYRAAAFEPAEQKSGHQYQDNISFYQAVRDTGYQVFTEFIPSGKSVLSYQLKVVQEGTFINGPAVLSCMYKPEIAAYSDSFVIKTTK